MIGEQKKTRLKNDGGIQMKCENCLQPTKELFEILVDGEIHEVCLECYESSRGYCRYDSETKLNGGKS